jgi:hypothetical protein
MSLGRREARHQTVAAAHVAGVEPSADWDFQPGQRVQTVDGLPGRVTAVQDGPVRGAEGYEVTLDDGMGGGLYTSSQLAPAPETVASLQETAAADYPELEDILQTRPDIARNTVLGSLKEALNDAEESQASSERANNAPDICQHCGAADYDDNGYCGSCGTHIDDDEPQDNYDDDPQDPHYSPDARAEHSNITYASKTAADGDFDDDGDDGYGNQVYCTDCHAFHGEDRHKGSASPAKDYDGVDTSVGGDTLSNGMSSSSDSASNSVTSGLQVEAEWSYNHHEQPMVHVMGQTPQRPLQAGDHVMHPNGQFTDKVVAAAPSLLHMEQSGIMHRAPIEGDDSGSITERRVISPEEEGDASKDVPKASPEQLKYLDSNSTGPTKYSALDIFDPFDILITASTDPEFRFEVTAAWSDVRAKAKRIRTTGGVHVTMATEGMIFAEVKGDHHVYETGLQTLPGKHSVQGWSCGCKWGAYHWGADDDFSRFAGRMCSHALALQFEAQSRGMFGKTVEPDMEKPSWVPRRVVVKYDINDDKNRSAKPTYPDYGRVAMAMPNEERDYDQISPKCQDGNHEGCEDYPDTTCVCSCHDHHGVPLDYRDSWKDEQHYQPRTFPKESALSVLAAYAKSEGFTDGDFAVECVLAGITGSVNSPWGEPQPEVPEVTGPTRPPHATDNPASQGFASAPDPKSWDHGITPDTIGMAASKACGRTKADYAASEADDDCRECGKKVSAHSGEYSGGEYGESNTYQASLDEFLFEAGGGPTGTGGSMMPDAGSESTLHDEPEAALPHTDGELDRGSGLPLSNGSPDGGSLGAGSVNIKGDPKSLESDTPSIMSTGGVDDIVASFQQKAAHLNPNGGGGAGDSDIAAAASEYLAKEAVKDFSPGEQATIINEGQGVTAANLDRLDIAGTHYEPLEAALAARDAEEDDDAWMA